MWTGFSLPFHWGFRNRFLRDDKLTVCSSLSHLQQGLLANTPGVLSRGLELLISEVSEPFIRDQTSRITPASVSSRGTSCSERLSSKPRGRTLLLLYHLDDDEIMLISCTYPSVLEVGIFSFGISFPTFSFLATARHIVILSRH
jgi:hypothetical protein